MLNEALRLIRVFHDMNAKTLSEKLDISEAMLSKIEKNKAKPSIELLRKYAEIFNTTESALLMFADNLDEKRKRSPFKVAIRNKMFALLQALEGLSNDKKTRNSAK